MIENIPTAIPPKGEAPRKVRGSNIQVSDHGKSGNKKNELLLTENGAASEIRETSAAKAKKTARALEDYAKSMDRDLKIQVHGTTGDLVVKVISSEDGRIIREIPPKEWLKLAEKMQALSGLLLDKII